MSGFPPPNPPKNLHENPFVSPFSLDEGSEDDKSATDAQTTLPGNQLNSNQPPVTADNPPPPRLTSRPSQTSSDADLASPAVFTDGDQQQSHTPPVVTPRGSDNGSQQAATLTTSLWATGSTVPLNTFTTTTSPRGKQSLTADSITTTTTTNTTNTTNTTTNTTTTTTTTTTGQKNTVNSGIGTDSEKSSSAAATASYRLPELSGIKGKRLITHSQLTKQLVHAESHGYKRPLKGGLVDAVLRGKVWLKTEVDANGKSIPQSEEENVITQFAEPFMQHYFDTPTVKGNLDQVTKNYKNRSSDALALYGKLGAHDFNRNDEVHELMQPIVAPIADYVFGVGGTIKTSQMPLPVIAAMLALDEEIQIWFQKNGSGDPEDLLKARKNALTGIFGVRAFVPGYAVDLSKDKTVAEGYYRPLMGYLMAYLNQNFGGFIDSVIACPKKERDRIRREAAIAESRPVLPKSEREKIDQAKERFQNRKPSSLLVRLKDAVDGIVKSTEKNEPTSPRKGLQRHKTAEREAPLSNDGDQKSPRSNYDAKKNLGVENTEMREKKKIRERQAVLDQYLKSLSLHSVKDMTELGDILRGINKKIVNASSEEFRKFREDPDRYFQGFLREFIAEIQAKGAAPSSALQQFYIHFSESMGIDDSE